VSRHLGYSDRCGVLNNGGAGWLSKLLRSMMEVVSRVGSKGTLCQLWVQGYQVDWVVSTPVDALS
jgi:hypothetical protein